MMAGAASSDRARPWYKRPLLWIFSGVLALIVGLGATEIGSKPGSISYSDFLDQLDAGNVASVTLFGTQIEGHFKQPLATASAAQAPPQILFRSLVPGFGDPTLVSQLRKHQVSIGVASSQWLGLGGATILGVIGAALLAKPMLLIVAAAFVAGLFRVARGGKMDIRSTLLMLPMFRALPSQSAEKQSTSEPPRVTARSDPLAESKEGKHHCTRAWYMRPPVWLLGVVLLGLAAFGLMQLAHRPAAIAYGNFLDQLDASNVARVTFYGTQIDGNFKHAIAPAPASGNAPQTAFRSQVPDFGDQALLAELHAEHVPTDVGSSSGWLSWLGRLPWPMVVIVVGLLLAGLLKLGRSHGTSTGSGASMHPMMAIIGGLFGKNQHGKAPEAAPPPTS